MMIERLIVVMAAAGLGVAMAEDAPKRPPAPEPMTLSQMQQRNPAITNEMFTKADTDHNGLLDAAELRAGMQSRVLRPPGGGQGGPPEGAGKRPGGPPGGTDGRQGGSGGPPGGMGGPHGVFGGPPGGGGGQGGFGGPRGPGGRGG